MNSCLDLRFGKYFFNVAFPIGTITSFPGMPRSTNSNADDCVVSAGL